MSGLCDTLAKAMDLIEPNEKNLDENNKNLRWDVTKVTPDVLAGLSIGDTKAINTMNELLPNKNQKDKIKYDSNIAKNSVLSGDIFIEYQRQVQLAFATILDTMKAYEDIAIRDNIDTTNIVDTNGNMNVSFANVAQIVARRFNNSIGARITKGSPEQVAQLEFEQGSMILSLLSDNGIINVVDGNYVYNGQRLADGSFNTDYPKALSGKVIQINMEAFTGKDSFKDTSAYARTVTRLLTPVEEFIPNSKPSAKVNIDASRARGAYLTPDKVKTFSMLSKGARTINSDFIAILKLFKSTNDTKGYFDSIKDNNAFGTQELRNELFGVDTPIFLNTDTKQGDAGVARTKSSNLMNVLDNLDAFLDTDGQPSEFFYDYYSFRTDRSLAVQNVLNAQTDKHLARAITTHGSVDVKLDPSDEAFKKVVGLLTEDFGISQENINSILNNPNEFKSDDLDDFIEVFRNKPTAENQLKLLEYWSRNKDTNTLVTKANTMSLWNKIKALGILADMLDASKQGKSTFEMKHDVAPDASASGLFINMLQALSNSDASNIEDTLTSMGFIADKAGKFNVTVDSLYSLVANKLKPEVDETLNEDTRARLDSVDTLKQELSFIKSITNDSLNERDLAKYPVMKMGAYGQSDKNALIDVSKDLAWMVIKAAQSDKLSPENFNKLKERMVIGASSIKSDNTSTVDLISNAKNIQQLIQVKGHEQALVNYFNGDKNIAENLIKFTNDEVKDKLFNAMNADIKSIFEVITEHMKINEIPMSKLKILPPQTVLELGIDLGNINPDEYAKLLDKQGLPLTKRVETLTDTGLTINKEVANLPSFIVSTTHMIDAAIQHMSSFKSLQEYKEKFNRFAGIVPIHDAVNSDPHYAVLNDKNYVEATIEVNANYDKVQALIATAKALGIVDNEVISAIEAKLTDGIKHKQSVLADMRNNITESTYKGKAKLFGYRGTTETNSSDMAKVISLVQYNKLDANGKTQYRLVNEFFKNNPELKVIYDEKQDFTYLSKKGTEVITLTDKDSDGNLYEPNQIVNSVYHEVIHANTYNWLIDNKSDDKYKYLNQVLKVLTGNMQTYTRLGEKLSDYNLGRLDYITSKYREKSLIGIAELVAIAESEPEFVNEMVNALQDVYPEANKSDNTNQSYFRQVLNAIIDAVKAGIDKIKFTAYYRNKLKSEGIDAKRLFLATALIHEQGKESRVTNKVNLDNTPEDTIELGAGLNFTKARTLANDYSEYIGQSGKFEDPFSTTSRILNQYARNAIMMSLQSYGTTIFDGYLVKAHKENYRKYPLYKATVDYLNDASKNEHIQQIIHYINVDNFKDRNTRTKLLALIRNYEQERNKIDSSLVSELDDELQAKFDSAMIENINTVYGKLGLFNLNQEDTMYLDLISGKLNIDDAIKMQITKVPKDSVTFAENLANLYITGEVNKISLDNVKNRTSADKALEIDKLVALYGLKQTNGLDVIKEVIDKAPEAHTKMIVATTSIKSLLDKMYNATGATSTPIRGNVINDIFKDNFQIIPVTLEDYNAGLYNAEWEVLRKPAIGKLGLVYKINEGSTQPGLTTTNNYHVDGLMLSDYLGKAYTDLQGNNAVLTYSGVNKATKILFTEKEKVKLGIVNNPAHTLYRTMSHLKFLLDTQPIRDALVSKTFTMQINDKVKDANDLVEHIKNEDSEHPWFLKVNKNVAFNDLPKEVRQRYKPVTNVTSLGRMAEHVTHVRTDISPWLVGYKDIEIAERSPKLNKLAHVYKKLFTLMKIHWVIVNLIKLSKDAISNFTYLVSRNIPITKIYSYTKDGLEGLNSMNQLRNELLLAKVNLMGASTSELASKQKVVDDIENKLNKHPYAFVIKNGYLSSLSTDIVLKDTVTVTGLQHDIESIINKAMRNTKGDLNTIGKFIMSASKVGISTEDILNVVATQLDKVAVGKGSAKILENMANNLTKIKDKDDIAKYISQFIASPGSEVTKLGSAAIQSIEVLTKIVLHKHLKDLGMSEDETIQDVNDSLFDYTQNMPESLKVLSDYGVLLFPTFWARVQRTIYMLGRDNPVSLASAFTTAELLDIQSAHMVGSNIFSKFDNGSIFNSPELTIDALYAKGLFPG